MLPDTPADTTPSGINPGRARGRSSSPCHLSEFHTFPLSGAAPAQAELTDRTPMVLSFFISMKPALLIISTVDSDEVVASRPNDNPGWAVQVDLNFLQSDSYDALQGKGLVARSLLILTNSP